MYSFINDKLFIIFKVQILIDYSYEHRSKDQRGEYNFFRCSNTDVCFLDLLKSSMLEISTSIFWEYCLSLLWTSCAYQCFYTIYFSFVRPDRLVRYTEIVVIIPSVVVTVIRKAYHWSKHSTPIVISVWFLVSFAFTVFINFSIKL